MTEPQKQLVAAIDRGTTKVAAAVAEATGDPRHPSAKVLGIGIERTQGVRRGVVRDIEEALGDGVKTVYESERAVMQKLRRTDQITVGVHAAN